MKPSSYIYPPLYPWTLNSPPAESASYEVRKRPMSVIINLQWRKLILHSCKCVLRDITEKIRRMS